MIKNNKKGFTLVELLAVIVILGILIVLSIVGVTKLIDRSKSEQRKHQESTLIMAAESYLQSNRDQLPKAIGETTTIQVSTLKNNKYLSEDIKDASGKSCMTNSYVTAYKESKTKYIYKAHLYCGNETVPPQEVKPIPTIRVEFIDKDGNNVADLNKVKEATYRITITGGTKSDGSSVEIDGYSYSILTSTTNSSSMKEVYSSGTLSANRKSEIVIENSNNLKEYIDITTANIVKIKVTVRNVEGGLKDETVTSGGSSSGETTYKDTRAPVCAGQNPKPERINWINKHSGVKERKITESCTDEGESGCIRDTFTKTWPNTSEQAAETSTIQIKDNAGNTKSCTVTVKLDLQEPEIQIDAYKRNSSGNKQDNNSVFNGATKTSKGAADDAVTVDFTKYLYLNGTFMNAANYPYGVVYEVTLKDNLALDTWKWETNAGNLVTTDNSYQTVSASGPEHANGSCLNQKTCTFKISFVTEGQRKGVLTVKDKAGNPVTYTIYANLDRTAPPKPTVTYKKVNTQASYTANTWSTEKVRSYVSGGKETKVSGWSRYEYDYRKQNDGSASNPKWPTYPTATASITNGTTSGYVINDDGTNKIKYRSCDKANNCSDYTNDDLIKIDTVAPTCEVIKTNLKSEPRSNGWYGLYDNNGNSVSGNGARVSRQCVENGAFGSGCNRSSEGHYDYTTDINTVSAGSAGAYKGGTVEDIAGNKANCSANQTVKIDKTPPKCGTTVGATNEWTNQDVTVTQTCNDSNSYAVGGVSGCAQSQVSQTYTEEEPQKHSITISDNAGNTTSCPVTVYIDKTPPTNLSFDYSPTSALIEVGSPRYWGSQNPTFYFRCDDSRSGVGLVTLQEEGATSVESSSSSPLPLGPPTEGNHVYTHRCVDRAGNDASTNWQIVMVGDPPPAVEDPSNPGSSSGSCSSEACTPRINANTGDTDEIMYLTDQPDGVNNQVWIGGARYIKISHFQSCRRTVYGCKTSGNKTRIATSVSSTWATNLFANKYADKRISPPEIYKGQLGTTSSRNNFFHVYCTGKNVSSNCSYSSGWYSYQVERYKTATIDRYDLYRYKCTEFKTAYEFARAWIGDSDLNHYYFECQ